MILVIMRLELTFEKLLEWMRMVIVAEASFGLSSE